MGWQETTAGLLLGLGVLFSLLNWVALAMSLWSGKFHSPVPLVGGLSLVLGASLLPPLRPYAWAGIVLDYGTLAFALSVPGFARELWATSWFNLVEECVGARGRTTVRVRLFRRGVSTVNWDITRPAGELGLVGMGQLGTWERDADRLVLRVGEDRAVLVPLSGGQEGWRPAEWFAFCRDSPDLGAAGVELLRQGPRAWHS
jgi:hypothetical protein